MGDAVLLIDYGPRSIGRISSLLRRAGYPTEVATDGVAGMEAFGRVRPGLTLIQDLLPRRQGFEICRLLKRTALGRMSDVVMITSSARSRLPQLRSSGCDGFVEKPFDDDQLLAAVRRMLGPPASPTIDVETSELSDVDAELLASIGSSGNALPGSIPIDLTEVDVDDALDAMIPAGKTGPAKLAPRRRARRSTGKRASKRTPARKLVKRRKKRAAGKPRATALRIVSSRRGRRGIKRPRK